MMRIFLATLPWVGMFIPMRFLLGLILIATGAYLAGQTFLPESAQLSHYHLFPAFLVKWLMPLAGLTGAVGLVLLLLPRRHGQAISDKRLVALLNSHGFRFTHHEGGWQASGAWRDVPMVVRLGSGFEAARFGRPWVIAVSLPGRPAEPWPLMPSQGKVIDLRADGFTVSLPDMSFPEQQGLLAARLDTILHSRHP